MKLRSPNNYKFVRFESSNTKGKKYDAVLQNKKTGKPKRVPFGAKGYEQYKDSEETDTLSGVSSLSGAELRTGLGLYSRVNHLDDKRRERYRARHAGEDKNKFSSGWFSMRFLWR